MAQPANPSSIANCLKDRLAEVENKAKAAEFQQQIATTLQELLTAKEVEITKYKDALQGIVANWKEQDEKLREMKRHLESCYPNWECDLKHSVCTNVICKNLDLKDLYESKMGAPELRLEYAQADSDKAQKHLDAWKSITTWINSRLDDNKALYEKICALDSCNKPMLQLYLFYFVLWPQHLQLCKSPDKLKNGNEINPAKAYCLSCHIPDESCTCLAGYPWIINPDRYDCQLTRVWETLRIVGEKLTVAQAAYEQIAKEKEEYQDSTTTEALEQAAEEALAKYDQLEVKPCPEADDCKTTTQEVTSDPCKIDPCKTEQEEQENCQPKDTYDPCNPPGWVCPDPCEEPLPETCKEPEPEEEPETDGCKGGKDDDGNGDNSEGSTSK